jgi:hypothetical protein
MRTLVQIVVLVIFVLVTGPASMASPMAISPSLGTAKSFAVLAGTAITNVPTSAISGDVGLSPAAGSNYGAGFSIADMVTGTIYAVDATGPAGSVVNPGLLTTAKTDLVAAYDALAAAAQPCITSYAGTKDLVGLSLVPGVYCAGAFTLSGVLTLTGTITDVWIFQSADTLITAPGGVAKVQFLDKRSSACNVWWWVASSATLDTNTAFKGNILALTSITMNTGATIDGRVLARNGAVTMQSNTISICALTPSGATTQIHNDANHAVITSAPIGTIVHDTAAITGTVGITPTGIVTFTVYTNQTCAGGGAFAGAVPLDGAGVADPSNTSTLTSAGLSYIAQYGGDTNYTAATGPCEILSPLAIVPSITTLIHDASHTPVNSAPISTTVHDEATVSGTVGIPTGTVDFTVYTDQICSAGATAAGTVALVVGVAHPSNTAILSDTGLSFLAHYNGDANYSAADGPCEVLVAIPTAVELLYFQANPLNDQQVELKWATAVEIDNFGFNLYRANVDDLDVALAGLPIHFEPAVTQGSGSGATYVYIDTAPYAGPWWYWLSDVDTKGRETFHTTPIKITVQPNGSLQYHIYLPFIAMGNGN